MAREGGPAASGAAPRRTPPEGPRRAPRGRDAGIPYCVDFKYHESQKTQARRVCVRMGRSHSAP